jgi:hypothetical protein
MRMARAMLQASKLPLKFYAEAQLTASYLYNRYVHGTDSMTPYEHVYGRKPDLSHLRRFGCICYTHVPLEANEAAKLGNSGERCRLIGYGDDDDTEEILGYKLYREADGAIIYSKDVIFDEKAEMKPFNNEDESLDEDVDDVFGDPTYEQPDASVPPELLNESSDEEFFSATD